MDDAFAPLSEMLGAMVPVPGEIVDRTIGVRSRIQLIEVESSIELDVSHVTDGVLRIGSAPPLYRVDTSYRPSYHTLRFSSVREDEGDAS
jgi:hypothetical protein